MSNIINNKKKIFLLDMYSFSLNTLHLILYLNYNPKILSIK